MATDDILEKAKAFAASAGVPVNTGHLLLMVLKGTGTAARTLSLRSVSETQIRAAIRDEAQEPENAVESVMEKSAQYAKTVGVAQPAALHVLAALATVRSSLGYQILEGAGLNCDTIRHQSLRNMVTGLTPEHGSLPLLQNKGTRSTSGAGSSHKGSRESAPGNNAATGSKSPAEDAPPAQRVTGIRLPRDEMGLTIEQVQRKARAARTRPAHHAHGSRGTATPQHSHESDCIRPDTTPQLSAIGRNLVAAARNDEIDPIVGRHAEIEQLLDILHKRKGRNPCLVGPVGVGKTAVVHGLATRIAQGKCPGINVQAIVEVRMSELIAGTSLRGAQSERIEELRKEIESLQGKALLFFDDIHVLLSSGEAAEAVLELKELLGRDAIQCIAATEPGDYNHIMQSDPTFGRLFTAVDIGEPAPEEAREILQHLLPAYARHHGIDIAPEVAEVAVRLSSRYLPEEPLPEKAIAVVDLASARAKRRDANMLQPHDIAEVIAARIGVPVARLATSDNERLLQLEQLLAESVVGHEHVLHAIGETLRRNAAGFRTGRPIGSFLFLGPTGVGKTETAKALARLLFADERAMIRLDMSEFSEPHAVARMVGAPPGYVGHEEGGQLTEAVRKRSYSLVLLDEIEKAHRDVVQVLLQVLDDGRLTDGRGRTVNFQNTVIVMTSNLGSDLRDVLSVQRQVGFGRLPHSEIDAAESDVSQIIEHRAKEALPPELWNRIDEPLVFAPLRRTDVGRIARLLIDGLSQRLFAERGISVQVEDAVIDHLIDVGGFDVHLGARPMRRTIQRLIEGPVARVVLAAGETPQDNIYVRMDSQGEIAIQ
ncbi:MAG: ATP-dependent Clp protease ATP-binding subunit [Myxococcales bacterium]|jgi:ATP-dependent Clp protease ATP-binding subunit ClpC|nr:ATP-dependent Clp protease ATP-binding subunit [Myxococcales bacterium]